jgi:hypothetical protein
MEREREPGEEREREVVAHQLQGGGRLRFQCVQDFLFLGPMMLAT